MNLSKDDLIDLLIDRDDTQVRTVYQDRVDPPGTWDGQPVPLIPTVDACDTTSFDS